MKIEGSCHCGAVRFEVVDDPKWIMECNCSICRRIGALWVHADIKNVTIDCEPEATIAYVQGDRTLAVRTCKTCGCTSHWESLKPESQGRMAVNVRLADPQLPSHLPIRHFDGADTWKFLD